MLRFRNVTLTRGERVLVQQLSLSIHHGWKVGLVGANGSGKSSLFQFIQGELLAELGDVDLPLGWRIAHLEQEVAPTDQPALEYVLDGDRELRAVERAIQRGEQSGDYSDAAELHDKLAALDGYTATARAAKLMAGLGFTQADHAKPLADFSGGWRIRLNLARTLLCPSDLLLLDEPTNHLDLDAIVWLEKFLQGYQGTLLLVSHDREFLDHVATSIAHLERQTIEVYAGNYSHFEMQRAERLADQESRYRKQQARATQLEAFIRRFGAKATKAKQAQSRLKALNRLQLEAPAHVDSPFEFSIPEADRTSRPLVALRKSDLGYESSTVLNGVSLQIDPGMRIGLLGPNGAGKSTFIKSLAGEVPLISGKRVTGHNLKIGYFSQHQLEQLDANGSALSEIQRFGEGASNERLRSFLGGFGFTAEKVFDPIAYFSGGERARLALALITWQRPNLLLLDEPTNHLDIEMRHALAIALQKYGGAVVLVSHDRYLLNNTVDQFLLVHRGKVAEFEGDLDDYESWLDFDPAEKVAAPPGERGTRPAAPQREDQRRQRRLRTQIEKVEQQLAATQQELQEIESAYADNSLYQPARREELQQINARHEDLKWQHARLEQDWISLHEELEGG